MENRKIKILLIEDSVDDAELIRMELEQSVSTRFQVITVKKLHDGLEQMAKNAPDLILSDLGLPDSHGLDTVTKILLAVPHIPLVVLSGFDDEDVAIRAVQAGAQDYLVKGHLENSQLERSIYYSIQRARLQVELEEHAQETLNVQANLHKILEKSADAIFVVGKDRRIMFTNPAVESLLGRKQKEILKQPFDFPLDVDKTTEIVIEHADKEKDTAEMHVVEFDWEGSPAYLVSLHNITTRKKYEEALCTSEGKYRNIIELAQDGIVTVDTQGQVTTCNQAFLRMIGVSEKEVVGKYFMDLPCVDTTKIPEYLEIFASILSGKKVPPFEMTLKCSDGTRKICELRSSLMKPNDKITGIHALIIDITERKKAEEAIRNSEKNLRMYLEGAPDGVYISSLKGTFIYGNKRAEEITGYKREELIGKNFLKLNLLPSKYYLKVMQLLATNMANKPTGPDEFKLRNKNGDHVWVEINTTPICQEGEVHVIGFVRNITKRKLSEKALRESEEKFSKAFLNSPEVIVISNMEDGTILEANETFLRLTGYSREEVIGKKTVEIGIWAIPEERARVINKLKEKGIVSNEECRFRMKSGEIRIWLFSAEIINIDNQPCMLSVTTDITDRKKMEDALRFSDVALRSIHEGIFAMDNEFKITHWNEICEQLYGTKASDAIGRPAAEVIQMVEEHEGHNQERIDLLLEKGFNKEEQLHRTSHGDIWLDVHAQAIIDDGKRYGWVTLVSDITERKQAEEALRFSDAAFKSIHESVIATDTKHIVTHWNKMSEKIYGIKASQAIGKDLKSSIEIVEIDSGENEKRFDSLNTNGYFQGEQMHRTRHGDVWVDVTAQAIEENGKRYGWVILASAITGRKLAEEALKRSEEKYRELISTSTDAIVSADSQMRVIIWNLGAENLLGYKEKEILGQSIMTIFPSTVQKDIARKLIKIKKSGTSKVSNKVFETYVMKKDCSLAPVDISISLRKTEDKNIITFIMRDITERKEAEEKLRKIDDMKSEFLSNVSHELRTPLQSISGFTKLIMNGQVEDPATQQEFLQIIDRETMHLGNLINSLLDMSRLEAGRFQIYKKLIPVRETFIESIKMFRSLARDKNITLSENIPPEIPEMEADNERLRQVVINLVGNAIKFSDPGTSINIKVEKQPNDLLFKVSDHGTGIREEAMKHLFERFYRVEDETVRGGTGLGLFISKQIVDAHGGRIWAESKYGEGSTFSFTLPLNGKGGNGNGKENSGH